MRDHSLACETGASRMKPSLSRDGESRSRDINGSILCSRDIFGLVARRIFITVCTVLLYSGTHQGPNILQCPNTEIYSTFVYIPHPPFYFLEFSLLYISHEASPREERKGVTDYVLCTINNTNSVIPFFKIKLP